MRFTFAFLILLISTSAQAKIFDFKRAHVATFVRGQYGQTLLNDTAYADSSGSGNIFDRGATTQFAGEAGVVLGSEVLNFIASAELVRPTPVVDAVGTTAAGAKLMTTNSHANAVVGTAGFEFLFFRRATTRFLFGVTGGYADVVITNDYTLNTLGQTTYSAMAPSHSETIHGTGFTGRAYLGFEFLMTANVTCSFDLGYRYMNVSNLHYTSAATTPNGTVSAGDTYKDNSGQDVSLDMSGAYGALSFRFYFL